MWRRSSRKILISFAAVFAVMGAEPASSTGLYLCFFDPGSAQVTDRCRQIVAEVARTWHALGGRLEVRGYAPDAGTPSGNKRLSLLRALGVSEELRGAGVPEEYVTPVGLGGDGMLIPNEPLSPHNRRVWMVFK